MYEIIYGKGKTTYRWEVEDGTSMDYIYKAISGYKLIRMTHIEGTIAENADFIRR